ncbi:MAG TPA: carboxypeptidase-like regulatory domain-containing protein [Candidatus Limnocylindria bacterium]|nr:carboxypeptidase-like regulatory domain-containing protein [Candidatus Limnocylindria bacterium]
MLVADGRTYKVVFYPAPGTDWATEWADDQPTIQRARIISVSGMDVPLDVVLDHGFVLSGVVRDPAGAPVAGAFVILHVAGSLETVAESRTGADGAYWITARPGQYKLRIVGPPAPAAYVEQWHPGRAVADALSQTFTLGPSQTADVVLQPGVRVDGTVTDGSAPVANVLVVAVDPAACCRQTAAMRTRSDGSYSLVVPEGSYVFRFVPPSASSYATQWDASAASSGTAAVHTYRLGTPAPRLDEVLVSGLVLSGRVTDTSGVGIAGSSVNVHEVIGNGLAFAAQAVTGSDGGYALRLRAATYKVSAHPPSGSSYLARWFADAPHSGLAQPIALSASSAPYTANMALPLGYTISGRITDATTGAGLDGVLISAQLPPASPGQCCTGAGGAPTRDGGYYTLMVPAGPYILGVNGQPVDHAFLWYRAGGGTTDPMQATVISGPPSVTGVDLALPAVQRISGTVRADGAAVGGANVSAFDANLPCCTSVTGARTAGDGTYTLYVPVGATVKVRFDPPPPAPTGPAYLTQYWDHASTFAAATPISAAAGSPVTGVDADLPPGYRISGRVTDSAGAGIAGVFVNANDAATPPERCCPSPAGWSITAADGTYAFVVPAGTHRVFANANGQPYTSAWYVVGVPVGGAPNITRASDVITPPAQSGIDIILLETMQISGTVTADGVGVGGVEVRAFDATKECCWWIAGASTQSDGSYTLGVPLNAHVKIHFDTTRVNAGGAAYLGQYWDGASSFANATTIDIATGTLTNVNAALQQGYLITGHVVDDTSDAPLGGAWVNAQQMLAGGWVWGGTVNSAGDGSFRLIVPAATYKVSIGHQSGAQLYVTQWFDGQQDPNLAADITVGPGLPVPDLSVRLVRGYAVTGRVVDASNNPLSGITVTANALLASGDCCQFISGVGTDQNGFFRLIAPAGAWLVMFSGDSYVRIWWQNTIEFQQATAITFGSGQTLFDLGTVQMLRP